MATRRNLWLAGALLGLVVLVAVASRAHAPAGGGATHGIDSNLLREFVLLAVAALFLLSLPLTVWALLSTRLESASTRKRNRRRIATFALAWAIVLVASVIAAERAHRGGGNGTSQTPTSPTRTRPTPLPSGAGKTVPFDWLPAIVVLSVAGVGAVAIGYALFRTPMRRVPTEAELAEQLSAVLDDSLDDLVAEKDPRRAVIAAYARMERTLAGAGLPREAAETPLEYLGRVLRELLHTSVDSVAKLTSLFEQAKFSPHRIDGGMKNEAIEALVAVRDELRTAAA
jgi:hypothetical protein